jgi:hypothetical protein
MQESPELLTQGFELVCGLHLKAAMAPACDVYLFPHSTTVMSIQFVSHTLSLSGWFRRHPNTHAVVQHTKRSGLPFFAE